MKKFAFLAVATGLVLAFQASEPAQATAPSIVVPNISALSTVAHPACRGAWRMAPVTSAEIAVFDKNGDGFVCEIVNCIKRRCTVNPPFLSCSCQIARRYRDN